MCQREAVQQQEPTDAGKPINDLRVTFFLWDIQDPVFIYWSLFLNFCHLLLFILWLKVLV